MQYFLPGLLIVIVFFDNVKALPAEPVCSKFDYEMKTLEAMLRIENRADKMMEEFRSVRDSLAKELDEIKNLKAKVERQQMAMESKFTALRSEAESQQTAMESKFTSLKSETERQQTAMESKFIVLRSEVEVPAEVIAFSVANPTKQLVSGVPTFKTVITNIGNGYDVDTGVFTCPVDGLYMFIFTVGSDGQHNVFCRIIHNGSHKVLGISHSDNSYTTASASVTLLLRKGDSVTLGGCHNWNHVYSADLATTFNGALLLKMERKN